MPIRLLAAPSALIALGLASAFALGACQHREPHQLEYTFQKLGGTEQLMLEDQQQLQHTSGVFKVLTTFDKGRIEIDLFVLEDNKIPGLEKAQELGYQQIRQ
jgi:hypothetical protein